MPSAELKMIIESRAQHWKRESALSPCSSVVALTAQRTSEDAWTCSVWSIELSTYAEVTAAGDQAATASSAHPRRLTSPERSKRAPASLVASGERRLRHFREGPESEKKDDELQVRGGRRFSLNAFARVASSRHAAATCSRRCKIDATLMQH